MANIKAVDNLLSRGILLLEDLEGSDDYKEIINTEAVPHIYLKDIRVRLTGNLNEIKIYDLNNIRLNVTYMITECNTSKSINIVLNDKDASIVRRYVKTSTGIDMICKFNRLTELSCIELTAFNLPLKFPLKICSGKDRSGNIVNYNSPIGCGCSYGVATYCNHCFSCGSELEDVYDIYEYYNK